MNVIFFSGKGPLNRLIQFFTFSKWDHVGIEIDGKFYEAELGGVQEIDLNIDKQIFPTATHVTPVKATYEQKIAIKNFLKAQVGKKYDWTALLALPFRSKWYKEDKWFCSELVSEALVKGKIRRFPFGKSRITPRDLYLILESKTL